MIDFPTRLLKSQLDSQLKRGSIIRTPLIFRAEPRFKRLILLNSDFSQDDIFYVLTTSEIDFFNRNQEFPGIKDNFLFIPKGQTEVNPRKSIVIDCRRVDIIKKGKLLQNYINKKLSFLGNIPPQILIEVDKIIDNSILISPKIKKLIL